MCQDIITRVLAGNITQDGDMAGPTTPKAKGKGKATAISKFYGPPSPPPAIPLPPLPDTEPAPGRMTNGFAAQARLRSQNERIKQGQQLREPRTPPNTPIKHDDQDQQSTSSESPPNLKSTVKSLVDPPQTPEQRELAVRFSLASAVLFNADECSEDEDEIAGPIGIHSFPTSSHNSALDVKWPTVPTRVADPFNEPRSPGSYHIFPCRYLRNEELYAEGMTLPNGHPPTLEDIPAPWAVVAAGRPLPAIPPQSDRDAKSQILRARKKSYRRLVKHAKAGHRVFSAVQFYPRRLEGISEQFAVGHVTKVQAKRFTGLSADFPTMSTWL
jgi:hypothetical protein